MAALNPNTIIGQNPTAVKANVGSAAVPIQGTIMNAKEVSGNRLAIQMVSVSPGDYAVGEILTIDGEEVSISSVSKPSIKSKSGTTLLQKSANILMPTNGSIKFNKIQVVMEF